MQMPRHILLRPISVHRQRSNRLGRFTFLQLVNRVSWQILELLLGAAWPGDLHAIHFGVASQAKVQAPVIRRVIATSSPDLVDLGHCRSRDGNSGANCGLVTFCTDQVEHNSVIRIRSLIDEDRRWFPNIENDEVEFSVVVDVAESRATPGF